MVDISPNVAQEGADIGPIAFEQPLNERMRMFLRIEFLYQQTLFHTRDESDFGTRAAVASLLEILAITGRGDVRSDVLKELDRHTELLNQYKRTPGVDLARLQEHMQDLDTLRGDLSHASKQVMAALTENEFLNSIQHRSAIPGGTCMFDLPEYGYWLHLPQAERAKQLDVWVKQLMPLCEAIGVLLWMTRQSSAPAECIADGGLYQHNLKKTDHYHLVRVLMNRNTGVFPEISAGGGKHRIAIRFAEWQGVSDRAKQTSRDVKFLLALC